MTPREETVEKLAERLYTKMSRLDPDEDDVEWSHMPDYRKQFYRYLVEDLARYTDWWLIVDRRAGHS